MNDQSKTIKLTRGYETIVDAEDYEELNKHKWYCCSRGYARRHIYKNQKGGSLFMHRIVNQTPEGLQTDHIDRDKLNNRKSNLRTVTHQQNAMNQTSYKNSTSIYKGVWWDKQRNGWQAQIGHNGKHTCLGIFSNECDAARAYDKAAEKLFGEYAVLNNRAEVMQ